MLYPAIALLSATIIAYEVVLARLFAIVQWHHYAHMVISIAMLGFGVSGTVLALARPWLLRNFAIVWPVSAFLFGASLIAGFLLAQAMGFNPLEIAWNWRQVFTLGGMYLVLTVPFFFGAMCIGLTFAKFGARIGRIYSWDLLGSGVGGAVIVALMFVLPPEDCLRLLLVAAVGAAALMGRGPTAGPDRLARVGVAVVGLLVAVALPTNWIAPQLSPYKGISVARLLPGAEIIAHASGPIGLIDVVKSPQVPFRYVPGLSLNNIVEPPGQLAIFTDGDNLTVITAFDGDFARLEYLDFTTAAAPYHLIPSPRVLVLGAGGGAPILSALYHQAQSVEGIILNPDIHAFLCETFLDYSGHICTRPDVTVHAGDARNFVSKSNTRWDLIDLPIAQSYAAAASAGGMSESFIYTVEALTDYLAHLTPEGMIAITRWSKLPPRDSLKLVNTAIEALRSEGVDDPGTHLLLIRSWDTSTLMIAKVPIIERKIATFRQFAVARSFDIAWYPGMRRDEANHFNVLEEPWFYDGARMLLGDDREAFLDAYKFALEPATDDRPYFNEFMRWQSLPEFLGMARHGTVALMEWTYIILITTLIQALVLSVILILWPLMRLKGTWTTQRGRAATSVYFMLLGIAFFFIEIAFIQKMTLFLGHPLYSIASVLSSFLVFAGIGAHLSPRLAQVLRRQGRAAPIIVAAMGIILSIALYLALSGVITSAVADMSFLIRFMCVLLLIMPLGLFMGMPFPLGLAILNDFQPAYVPWAWGINGCASVVGSILAAIFAIEFGFTPTMWVAAVLYFLAALAILRVVGDIKAGGIQTV